MRRYNDGMIYTTEKCAACNRCVQVCPAIGANVSTDDEGRKSVDVSDKNCIHCGTCVKECAHGARKYNDSLDDLLLDIKRGNAVSVIVDPTFAVAYGDKKARQIFGYLKSLGIKGIYDGSVGGEISLYLHAKYLKENADENGKADRFFAHTCPGFSNYVSRYEPNALERFVPVQLPNVCAAIYYRKYKQIVGRFALLSPCTAIFDEFSSYNSGRNINYLIGYSSLLEHIGDTDISGFDSGFDLDVDGCAVVMCHNEAFNYAVSSFFSPKFQFKSTAGLDEKYEKILSSGHLGEREYHPSLVTVNICLTGCIEGPAIADMDIHDSAANYSALFAHSDVFADGGDVTPDERYKKLADRYSSLNVLDFAWEGEEDYHQKCAVPENVVEEIFTSMHKNTQLKKELNCQACGYRTCREMACAVANGYSRIEDCVHYLNDELKIQMGIDSLTGLYNQRGFIKAATRLIADNPETRYVLAIGDINGLGGINDLYGNNGGDHVITYIAKVLEEFSDKRGLCSRMGAGVFGCIFPDTSENIEKFKNDTQVSVSHLGIEYPLSIKFGLYEINDRSQNLGRSILYATYAYRTIKDRSRNRYVFYTEEMSKSISSEAEITQKMKSAMENGEFVLYLQPKYDHLTGDMVGAEVLSRWVKPDGNVVSPGLFIPVFEKNGYITELDRFVWKSSYVMISKWIGEGKKPIPVSVNISRISLLGDGIVAFIEELGEKYPDAIPFIQYEITESAYADNVSEIFSRVEKIRNLGYRVNMDDFGSGYSSLNLLKDAPIDIVKLDMGFLRGKDNMDRGNVIISSVVDMTKKLGFELVAEGVETKEQADLLTDMGCNVIQGFYYARPMPEDDFVKRLIAG